jgi:hypothetical protein
MTGSEARRLTKGGCVLIHSAQFLPSRWLRQWVRATVAKVRENVTRPDVPTWSFV